MVDDTQNNKEIINFFEYIRTISTKENGEIDIEKFKSILYSASSEDLGVKYICSKLPEFFLRGCSVFKPYLDIALDREKNDPKTGEELLLKLKNGDFSEQLYPYIQMISELMDNRFIGEGYIVEEKLWKIGEFVPEKWKYLLSKYQKIYDEIVKCGMFSYKGSYISGHSFSYYDVAELMKKNPEDSDLIEFAGIVVNCLYGNNVFRPFNLDDLASIKKSHEETLKTIQEYEDKLEELDRRIKKYGLIKSLTKRKDKKELIKKKNKLIKDLEYKKDINKSECAYIKFHEDMLEFSECYKRKYAEKIKEVVFPKIKKVIADKYGLENQQIIDSLLDNIYKNFFTVFFDRPTTTLVKEMSAVKDASFKESLARLDNAIMTLLGMPNVAIAFEKSPNKDLYSVLGIIRSELMKIPSDSDHGQLDDSFRNHELAQDTNNFMAHTSNHEHLDEIMSILNQQFIDLMKEDDIEKYIKKVGEIWYQFMLIHPYADGNGRTGRYLLNVMLAQRNLIIPALYDSQEEKDDFEHSLDRYVADRFERLPGRAQFDGKRYDFLDFDGLGEEFLKYVRDKIIDLSGKDRLKNSRPKDENTVEDVEIDEFRRRR